jgi:hypothetical protein
MSESPDSRYIGQFHVRGGKLPYVLVAFTDCLIAVLSNPTEAILGTTVNFAAGQQYTDAVGGQMERYAKAFMPKTEFQRAERKTGGLDAKITSQEFAERVKVKIVIPTDSVERVTAHLKKGQLRLSVFTDRLHLVSLGKGYGFSVESGDELLALTIMGAALGSRFINKTPLRSRLTEY